MLTNQQLEAELRADPSTAELAEEQGLTVDEYIAATLKFLDDPDQGFLDHRDGPDCEHGDGDDDHEEPESSYEPARRASLPVEAPPGTGVASQAPVFALRPRTLKG
jgi:DNA-directed RNA polymerase specialized sigma subunit